MSIDDGGPAFPVCPGFGGHSKETVTKFLGRVCIRDMNECWEWIGAHTQKGYGVFAPSKWTQHRAHRFAFSLYTGRAPKAMVLHTCDNPGCVNPLHLQDGDHGENMRQMAERRRAAREDRHHKAKLTTFEVLAMNVLYRSGDYTTRDLEKMFPVSQPTIAAIVRGDLWPDVYSAADAMLAARQTSTGQ